MTAARKDGRAGPGTQHHLVIRVVVASAPGPAAVLGAAPLSALLLTGVIPPGSPLVWPLVVLALGAMAHDLVRLVLQRATRPASSACPRADRCLVTEENLKTSPGQPKVAVPKS